MFTQYAREHVLDGGGGGGGGVGVCVCVCRGFKAGRQAGLPLTPTSPHLSSSATTAALVLFGSRPSELPQRYTPSAPSCCGICATAPWHRARVGGDGREARVAGVGVGVGAGAGEETGEETGRWWLRAMPRAMLFGRRAAAIRHKRSGEWPDA